MSVSAQPSGDCSTLTKVLLQLLHYISQHSSNEQFRLVRLADDLYLPFESPMPGRRDGSSDVSLPDASLETISVSALRTLLSTTHNNNPNGSESYPSPPEVLKIRPLLRPIRDADSDSVISSLSLLSSSVSQTGHPLVGCSAIVDLDSMDLAVATLERQRQGQSIANTSSDPCALGSTNLSIFPSAVGSMSPFSPAYLLSSLRLPLRFSIAIHRSLADVSSLPTDHAILASYPYSAVGRGIPLSQTSTGPALGLLLTACTEQSDNFIKHGGHAPNSPLALYGATDNDNITSNPGCDHPPLSHGISPEAVKLSGGWRRGDLDALYDALKPTPGWDIIADEPQGLRCKLRLYQRKALAWMLMRERGQVTGTKSQIQTHISQKSRHSHNGNDDRTGAIDNVQSNVRDTRTQEGWVDPRWRTLRLHVIPYHHFDIRAGNWAPLLWLEMATGFLQGYAPPPIPDFRGGILADSMGLGKTVEMIALILSNLSAIPKPTLPLHNYVVLDKNLTKKRNLAEHERKRHKNDRGVDHQMGPAETQLLANPVIDDKRCGTGNVVGGENNRPNKKRKLTPDNPTAYDSSSCFTYTSTNQTTEQPPSPPSSLELHSFEGDKSIVKVENGTTTYSSTTSASFPSLTLHPTNTNDYRTGDTIGPMNDEVETTRGSMRPHRTIRHKFIGLDKAIDINPNHSNTDSNQLNAPLYNTSPNNVEEGSVETGHDDRFGQHEDDIPIGKKRKQPEPLRAKSKTRALARSHPNSNSRRSIVTHRHVVGDEDLPWLQNGEVINRIDTDGTRAVDAMSYDIKPELTQSPVKSSMQSNRRNREGKEAEVDKDERKHMVAKGEELHEGEEGSESDDPSDHPDNNNYHDHDHDHVSLESRSIQEIIDESLLAAVVGPTTMNRASDYPPVSQDGWLERAIRAQERERTILEQRLVCAQESTKQSYASLCLDIDAVIRQVNSMNNMTPSQVELNGGSVDALRSNCNDDKSEQKELYDGISFDDSSTNATIRTSHRARGRKSMNSQYTGDQIKQQVPSASTSTNLQSQDYSDTTAQLILSPATLVVCPTSLIHQWRQELTRHAPHLRHVAYHIVGHQYPSTSEDAARALLLGMLEDKVESFADRADERGARGSVLPPQRIVLNERERAKRGLPPLVPSSVTFSSVRDHQSLPQSRDNTDSAADYPCLPEITTYEGSNVYSCTLRDILSADVVVTTYEVLAAQINFGKHQKYTFRQAKKYNTACSPLLQIHWHRCILDEAQHVRSAASTPATMAARISATYRWCVSGTPIGARGLTDLFGLLLFLHAPPFAAPTLADSLDETKIAAAISAYESKKAKVRELQLLRENIKRLRLMVVRAEQRAERLHQQVQARDQQVKEELELRFMTYQASLSSLRESASLQELHAKQIREQIQHAEARLVEMSNLGYDITSIQAFIASQHITLHQQELSRREYIEQLKDLEATGPSYGGISLPTATDTGLSEDPSSDDDDDDDDHDDSRDGDRGDRSGHGVATLERINKMDDFSNAENRLLPADNTDYSFLREKKARGGGRQRGASLPDFSTGVINVTYTLPDDTTNVIRESFNLTCLPSICFGGPSPVDSSNSSTWTMFASLVTMPLGKGIQLVYEFLRRLMWRHSKKHVVEEIRLPPLHLQAVYLRFTAIEHEFYRKYLSDIKGQIINAVLTYQSNLDAKAGKKRSGSAAKDSILPMIASKLEGLRMVCDHPQVSTQSFLGVRVMTMPEIAAALRRKARDETTEHERKLARDYNALGLFYLSFPRQYSAEMAEKAFTHAWVVCDQGITDNALQLAQTQLDPSFDHTEDIITANNQVRHWRMIEFCASFHIMNMLRCRLQGADPHSYYTTLPPQASTTALLAAQEAILAREVLANSGSGRRRGDDQTLSDNRLLMTLASSSSLFDNAAAASALSAASSLFYTFSPGTGMLSPYLSDIVFLGDPDNENHFYPFDDDELKRRYDEFTGASPSRDQQSHQAISSTSSLLPNVVSASALPTTLESITSVATPAQLAKLHAAANGAVSSTDPNHPASATPFGLTKEGRKAAIILRDHIKLLAEETVAKAVAARRQLKHAYHSILIPNPPQTSFEIPPLRTPTSDLGNTEDCGKEAQSAIVEDKDWLDTADPQTRKLHYDALAKSSDYYAAQARVDRVPPPAYSDIYLPDGSLDAFMIDYYDLQFERSLKGEIPPLNYGDGYSCIGYSLSKQDQSLSSPILPLSLNQKDPALTSTHDMGRSIQSSVVASRQKDPLAYPPLPIGKEIATQLAKYRKVRRDFRVALEDLTQETTDNLMKTLPHVRDYRVMLDEAYSQALPQAQSQSQTEQHSTKGDESKWHVIELTGDETHNKKEREKPTLHPRRPLLPEALQLLRRRHELLAIPKEAINEDDDKSADEVANMRRTRGGNSGTSTSSAWSQTHKKEKKLSAEAKKRLHDSKYIKSLSDNYAKGKAFLQECLFVCDYIDYIDNHKLYYPPHPSRIVAQKSQVIAEIKMLRRRSDIINKAFPSHGHATPQHDAGQVENMGTDSTNDLQQPSPQVRCLSIDTLRSLYDAAHQRDESCHSSPNSLQLVNTPINTKLWWWKEQFADHMSLSSHASTGVQSDEGVVMDDHTYFTNNDQNDVVITFPTDINVYRSDNSHTQLTAMHQRRLMKLHQLHKRHMDNVTARYVDNAETLPVQLNEIDWNAAVTRVMFTQQWELYRDSLQVTRILLECRRLLNQLPRFVEAHKLIIESLHDPLFVPVMSMENSPQAPGSNSSHLTGSGNASTRGDVGTEGDPFAGYRELIETSLSSQIGKSKQDSINAARHEKYLNRRFGTLQQDSKIVARTSASLMSPTTPDTSTLPSPTSTTSTSLPEHVPLTSASTSIPSMSPTDDSSLVQANPQGSEEQYIAIRLDLSSPTTLSSPTGSSATAEAANQTPRTTTVTSSDDLLTSVERVSECPICRDRLVKPMLTWCGHLFCQSCITHWLTKQRKCCPTCRQQLFLDTKHLYPVADEEIMSNMPTEHKTPTECGHAPTSSVSHRNISMTSMLCDPRLGSSSASTNAFVNGPTSTVQNAWGTRGDHHLEGLPHPQSLLDTQVMEGATDFGSKVEAIVKYLLYLVRLDELENQRRRRLHCQRQGIRLTTEEVDAPLVPSLQRALALPPRPQPCLSYVKAPNAKVASLPSSSAPSTIPTVSASTSASRGTAVVDRRLNNLGTDEDRREIANVEEEYDDMRQPADEEPNGTRATSADPYLGQSATATNVVQNDDKDAIASHDVVTTSHAAVDSSIDLQTTKSLVFSQFTRMLDVIALALRRNGISYLYLKGRAADRARQIARFTSDQNVRVLLMSLRTDNSGLTLTTATHVFLAEPSLSRAIEAQAIARVHRIGQMKPSFVHKFIMHATVEEKIVEMQTQEEQAALVALANKSLLDDSAIAGDEELEDLMSHGNSGIPAGTSDVKRNDNYNSQSNSSSNSSSERTNSNDSSDGTNIPSRAFIGPHSAVDVSSGSLSIILGKENWTWNQLINALELENTVS